MKNLILIIVSLCGFQASADRILSIKHSTKLETLEAAFAVLGKWLEFGLV